MSDDKVLDKMVLASGQQHGWFVADVADFEERVIRDPITTFKLNPELKYLMWLQRALEWLLRKMGCIDDGFAERMVLHRIELQPDTILDKIVDAAGGIHLFFDRKCSTILIGQDEFRDVLRALNRYSPSAIHDMTSLRGEPTYFKGRHRIQGKFIDLDVVLIPWMKGLMIL